MPSPTTRKQLEEQPCKDFAIVIMRRPRRAAVGVLSPLRALKLGKIRRRACLRLIPFPGTGDVLLAPTMISHPLAYVARNPRQNRSSPFKLAGETLRKIPPRTQHHRALGPTVGAKCRVVGATYANGWLIIVGASKTSPVPGNGMRRRHARQRILPRFEALRGDNTPSPALRGLRMITRSERVATSAP